MIFLALVVLLTIGLPITVWLLQGVAAILEFTWFVVYSLWRLCMYLRGLRQTTPAAPMSKYSSPNSSTPIRPTPADPTRLKRKNVERHWRERGDRIGVINLDTGEIFEPAVPTKEVD